MKRKFIITAEMRDLEQRVAKGEISYSRMIEILCEKADEYAEEYHQSELLKLNKSDVSGSLVSPNSIQKEAEKYQQATANNMAIERTAFAQGALWVRSLFLPNDR